jgi:hypothetical protein
VRQNWEREVSMRFGEKSQWMEVRMALMRVRERERARARPVDGGVYGSDARKRERARARTFLPLHVFNARVLSCVSGMQVGRIFERGDTKLAMKELTKP